MEDRKRGKAVTCLMDAISSHILGEFKAPGCFLLWKRPELGLGSHRQPGTLAKALLEDCREDLMWVRSHLSAHSTGHSSRTGTGPVHLPALAPLFPGCSLLVWLPCTTPGTPQPLPQGALDFCCPESLTETSWIHQNRGCFKKFLVLHVKYSI